MIIKYNLQTKCRLDVFVAQQTNLTRSYIKTLNDNSNILVNGKPVKAGFLLSNGDVLDITLPEVETIDTMPEDIPLNIVYEDDQLVVINKQIGLVVHPCNTTKKHTLVNALMYHIKKLSAINGVLRPGIVHRLDKDTGGLIIVAKTDEAHKKLSAQLKDKTLNRQYKALIKGRLIKDFEVEGFIGRNPHNRKQMAMVSEANGKYSKTKFSIDKVYNHYTLLNCTLYTGRTHQIRAHLKHIGHPIVGDVLYGGADKAIGLNTQFLFAYKIEFVHPTINNLMSFTIDLPNNLQNILKGL